MSEPEENKPKETLDEAAKAELDGVPESMKEGEEVTASSAEDSVAEIEAKLEEAKQDVLYAQAEVQNVRRRLEKDAQDARAYAVTGFARDLLSVMDNMQRALEAIPEEVKNEDKWGGLIGGIEATARELDKVFEQHGIQRVAAMGLPLDPNNHQAMIEIPTDEQEPGTIVQEMQPGYVIKDRLLRPAMVGVAKKADE